jgi:hypothetical protein
MHKGSIKNKLICRFALNTSFIQDNYYEFANNTVDPDSTVKDSRISQNFKIECYFKDFCQRCLPSEPIEEICGRCASKMPEEIKSWKIIKDILDVSRTL